MPSLVNTEKRYKYVLENPRLADKPYSVLRVRIYLGCPSRGSSLRSTRRSNEPSRFSLLFDLAPEGGCLAASITAGTGGLLHRLFTLTLACGLFLWPYPEAYASPGVTWLPALWCTDFPHSCERAHLTSLRT